mgnify:CR=1 FL=1
MSDKRANPEESFNLRSLMARVPVIDDIGVIPNKEEFSARNQIVFNNPNGYDTWLTFPDIHSSNLEISDPAFPRQYHPAVLKAVDDYAARHPDTQSVKVNASVVSGELKPDETLRLGGKHIDHIVYNYSDDQLVPVAQYIVSDNHPTLFYRQPYLLPEKLPVDLLQEYDGEVLEILSQYFEKLTNPATQTSLPPYHIARYDSFVVHEAQPATQTCDRTFMLMRFFPDGPAS